MAIIGYDGCAFYTINLIKINKHKIVYNYKLVLFGTKIYTLLGKYRNTSLKIFFIIIIKMQYLLEWKILMKLLLNCFIL